MIVSLSGTNGAVIDLKGSFTASSTTSTVVITIDNNGTVVYADNIVVKQEDAPRDYSADIKGSGTNKTPTLSGRSGVGYDIGGYYGLDIPVVLMMIIWNFQELLETLMLELEILPLSVG